VAQEEASQGMRGSDKDRQFEVTELNLSVRIKNNSTLRKYRLAEVGDATAYDCVSPSEFA
jgi:hypothetical protein